MRKRVIFDSLGNYGQSYRIQLSVFSMRTTVSKMFYKRIRPFSYLLAAYVNLIKGRSQRSQTCQISTKTKERRICFFCRIRFGRRWWTWHWGREGNYRSHPITCTKFKIEKETKEEKEEGRFWYDFSRAWFQGNWSSSYKR